VLHECKGEAVDLHPGSGIDVHDTSSRETLVFA
jgi:hypothetical protein